MLASQALLETLKAQHIQCYLSFPDKWLKPLLQLLDNDAEVLHLPVTIEREALGMAVGMQLAGLRSALVIQNSGIGNLLNDWASLAHNYRLPMPWIVSDRGSQGEQVTTQMIWHHRLRAMLNAADIPAQTFTSPDQLPEVSALIQYGYAVQQCVAALFPYAFWRDDLLLPGSAHLGEHGDLPSWPQSHRSPRLPRLTRPAQATWRRFNALTCVLEALSNEFLFVTLGDPCKEVYAIGDRDETFYMLGSMGLVLPLGMGFARAYAIQGGARKTVVLDGDGSQLMQLGSLGTLAREQPDLALIVIDNGSYSTTGDQPTLTRSHVDLEQLGQAFGLTDTATVATPNDLRGRLRAVLDLPGPSLTVVLVQPGAPITPQLPLPPVAIAQRFRATVAASYHAMDAHGLSLSYDVPVGHGLS